MTRTRYLLLAGFLAACSNATEGSASDRTLPKETVAAAAAAGDDSFTGETRSFTFEGESMDPTLMNGQSFDVAMLTGPANLTRGDVVLLKRLDGQGGETLLAKRVVALPGETIEISSCQVLIDGVALEETYIDREREVRDGCGPDQAAIEVPDGAVFVLGDYRGRSSDSRAFGPVAVDFIVGVAQL